MSSPNPWIYEAETGRWYMNGKDEFGRSVRQYEQSSSNSSYQNPSAVPRTLPSSRRSSSKAPHRHSESSRESKQSQPARNTSYDKHSKQYHSSGGYDRTQDTSSSQRMGYTPSSKEYERGTASYEGAQNYGSSSTSAPIGTPSASIASGMNSLSLDDRGRTPTAGYGSSVPVVTSSYTTSYTPTSGYSAPLVGTTQGTTSRPLAASRDEGEYGAQGGGVASPDLAESQNDDHRYVTGTPGESEKLDPRYQVRNHDYKKFFKAGRVFSTLWTVPASGMTNKNETFISFVKYGEKVHTKIRRFVVVQFKSNNKRCTCLPVTSYEGRGYKKPDIDPEEHGPIYSSKKPPKTDQGVTKKPLKVVLSKNAESLRDPSLVNYGCIYTVETNVKVMDVGVLDEASLEALEAYYREVNFSSGGSPTAADTSHQRKDQYLTGVGSSFGANSSTYDNRIDSMTATPGHNRTVSFSTQPNSYSKASTDNTYRVPIGQPQSQTGYSSTSYNPQSRPEQPPMTSSSTYPSSSNVQYTTPHGSTDTRYPSYGSSPPATTGYPSTEGGGSNPGFSSPTSETSGYNYTTQPQTSVSMTPYARSGYTDNRTPYQSTEINSPPYQTVTQSGGQAYSTSYATNPRSSTNDNAYYTSPPATVSSSYSSRTQPAQTSYGNSTYTRNDNDGDIELPTHGEIAASRQQRSRRESVSKPSRHEKSGSSRHHDRTDRDRKERKK